MNGGVGFESMFRACSPPLQLFLFRELYLEGYDLIKTIVSKLKYYKTRQDAEFHKNTFKEDQKCH